MTLSGTANVPRGCVQRPSRPSSRYRPSSTKAATAGHEGESRLRPSSHEDQRIEYEESHELEANAAVWDDAPWDIVGPNDTFPLTDKQVHRFCQSVARHLPHVLADLEAGKAGLRNSFDTLTKLFKEELGEQSDESERLFREVLELKEQTCAQLKRSIVDLRRGLGDSEKRFQGIEEILHDQEGSAAEVLRSTKHVVHSTSAKVEQLGNDFDQIQAQMSDLQRDLDNTLKLSRSNISQDILHQLEQELVTVQVRIGRQSETHKGLSMHCLSMDNRIELLQQQVDRLEEGRSSQPEGSGLRSLEQELDDLDISSLGDDAQSQAGTDRCGGLTEEHTTEDLSVLHGDAQSQDATDRGGSSTGGHTTQDMGATLCGLLEDFLQSSAEQKRHSMHGRTITATPQYSMTSEQDYLYQEIVQWSPSLMPNPLVISHGRPASDVAFELPSESVPEALAGKADSTGPPRDGTQHADPALVSDTLSQPQDRSARRTDAQKPRQRKPPPLLLCARANTSSHRADDGYPECRLSFPYPLPATAACVSRLRAHGVPASIYTGINASPIDANIRLSRDGRFLLADRAAPSFGTSMDPSTTASSSWSTSFADGDGDTETALVLWDANYQRRPSDTTTTAAYNLASASLKWQMPRCYMSRTRGPEESEVSSIESRASSKLSTKTASSGALAKQDSNNRTASGGSSSAIIGLVKARGIMGIAAEDVVGERILKKALAAALGVRQSAAMGKLTSG